jgi:cyclopropane fatty-acyl-phospholipid synthase-like methyltransferase
MAYFEKMAFEYYDFREACYTSKVDAIYLIDTIEHIYPEEEAAFMENLAGSLVEHGVCIIGTPNIAADKFANNWSRDGHVNLKSPEALMELSLKYFHNAFFFSMNDEMIHTGFPPMSHFMWTLCVGPRIN